MVDNKTKIITLFMKSGKEPNQQNLLKTLKDMFIRSTWEEFVTLFVETVMSVVVTLDNTHQVVVTVNNMIKFAAHCVSMLSEYKTSDGRTGLYLISEILRLFQHYGNSNYKLIRFRFCLFLNHLLTNMSDTAIWPEELCEVSTALLLKRLKDKKPAVRAQAVHALNRLQNPDDCKSLIITQFIFHLTKDPSAEVRGAVVKNIAMFNNVIDVMLKSTLLDVSDGVRKEAYNRLLTYPYLSLSSKQRQTIVERGLADGNPNIVSLVKKRLLHGWLSECNDDFIKFLTELGVEKDKLCEKILIIIFESYYDSQVLDLAFKILNSDSRLIDYNKLTVEKIFLWNCISKYLTTEKKIELAHSRGHIDDDYIDVLLPDLVVFSDYVRAYYFTYNSINNKETILTYLLDIGKMFAMDDVGATSIKKLCFDLILDDQMTVLPIKSIAVLLDLIFRNGQDILNFVKEVFNEIQTQTIDVYPLIEKLGRKNKLVQCLHSMNKYIEELFENESENINKIQMLLVNLEEKKEEHNEITILPEEETLVNQAVKTLLKGFALVFEVQQYYKVTKECSLLTDIIENIISGFLVCSYNSLRMEAVRCYTPYSLANNNVVGAKEHILVVCQEISDPTTDRCLLFNILFELFLKYGLNTFEIDNTFYIEEENVDVYNVQNILPVLSSCIDYDIDDRSFKLVIVNGFCNLLLFEEVKSYDLLAKLFIIWFKPLTHKTFNLNHTLMTFFTSYVFYVPSSCKSLAQCYVPALLEIQKYDLIDYLGIKMKELNSVMMNLTRGFVLGYHDGAVNAHSELACYILEYIITDESQYHTAMLVDLLCKLEINFYDDQNIEILTLLRKYVKQVIKIFKHMDDKKISNKYLKKIQHKFVVMLEKKPSHAKNCNKKEVKDRMENIIQVPSGSIQEPSCSTQEPSCSTQEPSCSTQEPSCSTQEPSCSTQEPSCSTQKPDPVVETHGDLFAQEKMDVPPQSSDEEDDPADALTKLDAMKRMSEVFKKNFNTRRKLTC